MDVHPPNAAASSLVDLFPHEPTLEGGEDSSLEWLSFYVEDCLSSSTSYTNLVTPEPTPTTIRDQITTKPKTPPPSSNVRKKKRGLATVMCRNDEQHYVSWFLDPPLFNQTEWLAESELIIPKKDKDQALGQQQELGQVEEENKKSATLRRCSHCLSHLTPQWRNGPLEPRTLCDACDLRSKCSNELIFCNKDEDQEIDEEQEQAQEKKSKKCASVGGEPVKRCTHCMSYKTPQWRAGPLGPKTLCNACGVRFKSGRLLPEYRPANSPTFVSYKHSNSHKKVLQLRGDAVPSTRRAN